MPKILLLIDDPAFRGRLLPAFRAAGLDAVFTGDGEHARTLIAKGTDLIVVDAHIPAPGGLAWVRARREAGLALPIILCAASREEMDAFLGMANALALSSVVSRAVAPEAFARHVAGLFQQQPAEPEAAFDDQGPDLFLQELEDLRVSIVRLQQDPQSRDRMAATQTVASRLGATASTFATGEPVVTACRKIVELLADALDQRIRLDGGAFAEIERFMVRARGAAATGLPRTASRPSTSRPATQGRGSSAHEGGSIPEAVAGEEGKDPVSGLFSREAFLGEVQELVSGAMIDSRPLCLCVLEVTGLDALPAPKRDQTLREIGAFLAGRFRPADRRGRWGEAAFALGIPGTPATMAVDLLKRTVEAFTAKRLGVELGVGVACFPKDGKDAGGLLKLAERYAGAMAVKGGGVRGGGV